MSPKPFESELREIQGQADSCFEIMNMMWLFLDIYTFHSFLPFCLCPMTPSLFSPFLFHTQSILLLSLSFICHPPLPLSHAAHPYDVKVILIQLTARPPPRRCLLSSYLSVLRFSPFHHSFSPLLLLLLLLSFLCIPFLSLTTPFLLSSPLHFTFPSSSLCLVSLPQCMSQGKGVSHQWLHAQTGMIKWQSCPSSLPEALKTSGPRFSPHTLSLHWNCELAPRSCRVVLRSDSLWKYDYCQPSLFVRW